MVVGLLLGLLSGCDLQRIEYDKIFPENFYKNEADIRSAVTAAYNTYRINTWHDGIYGSGKSGLNIYPEVTTDVMDCQWGDGGSWEMYNTHGWTASNADMAGENTFSKYKNISRMRNVILQIEKSSVNETVKQKYIGEMKALRGWLMFCLMEIYGPIPIASDATLLDPTIEEILERPTEEVYVNSIISEFKDAIEMLPPRASEWGRVDGGAANMMLLKVYMHQKRWQEAEAVAREIMNAKYGYRLLDNYYDCFSLATEENAENIWVIPCNNENYVNAWVTHVMPGDCPYANSGIERWSGYRMPWEFYHTFEAKDKRLDNIIGEYISTSDGVTVVNEQNPGSELIKGALPLKYTVDPNQKGDRGGIDVPIFRFSDVLLTLAECIARQNGVKQECMDLINKVRNRVGLDDLLLSDYTDINKFYDMILLERGHELYCEGHRRADLIRFGKYIEFNKKVPNSQTADHKVLFPIPNKYIVESKGAIKQNNGY